MKNEPVHDRHNIPGLVVALWAGICGGLVNVAVDLLRVVRVIQLGLPITFENILSQGRVFHLRSVLVGALFVGVYYALYLGFLVISEITRYIKLVGRK